MKNVLSQTFIISIYFYYQHFQYIVGKPDYRFIVQRCANQGKFFQVEK